MVAASSRVLHLSLPEELLCARLFAQCQCCTQIPEQPGLKGTFPCHLVHAPAMGGDIPINPAMSYLTGGQSLAANVYPIRITRPQCCLPITLAATSWQRRWLVSLRAEEPQAHISHVFQPGLCIQLSRAFQTGLWVATQTVLQGCPPCPPSLHSSFLHSHCFFNLPCSSFPASRSPACDKELVLL